MSDETKGKVVGMADFKKRAQGESAEAGVRRIEVTCTEEQVHEWCAADVVCNGLLMAQIQAEKEGNKNLAQCIRDLGTARVAELVLRNGGAKIHGDLQ